MRPFLAGLDTEYGFSGEGRSPFQQVDDAFDFVSLAPAAYLGWNNSPESPRHDMRGFDVKALSIDPRDTQFDQNRPSQIPNGPAGRADRVLSNGARFYNDHGHPEYATPECWGCTELALHERAGDQFILTLAKVAEAALDRKITLIKNNIDYKGATWGTHENYLFPRSTPYADYARGLIPLLAVRCLLTGAGRIGFEPGNPPCDFQSSQRADFITVLESVDTLYKRPILNTRDEPHANAHRWRRIHVITGDANRSFLTTRRKIGLVKIALALIERNQCPIWPLTDPLAALRTASRSLYDDPLITVSGQPETTAARILESYCEAALRHLDSEEPAYAELRDIAAESLELLDQRRSNPVTFAQQVDWAAKHAVIGTYLDQTGDPWQSELARSLDLSYHDLDPNELYEGVVAAGYILGEPDPADVTLRLTHICEPTRALARSVAVTRFAAQLTGVSWGTLEFARGPQTIQVNLPPDAHYSESVADAPDVESFIRSIPESP